MNNFDIIIIGAGAAGMLAAIRAGELNKRVLILERMAIPGRKIRITGKGRCNLTNNAPITEFITKFDKQGKFLRPAFSAYFSGQLVEFFNKMGVVTKLERGGRIFPQNNEAKQIAEALSSRMEQLNITVLKNYRMLAVNQNKAQFSVVAQEKKSERKEFLAEKVIIATGGASYPATGSSGDGYRIAQKIGHSVVRVRPALVPLETEGDTAQKLQGVSLKNVRASLWLKDKKITEAFGEMLFTHFGVSGPIILTMSKTAVDLLQQGNKPRLSIDLKPALDHKKLDTRLLRDINAHGRQKIQTLLKGLLPGKMIPLCIDMLALDAHKPANQISSVERKQLLNWLKDLSLAIRGNRPFSEAIITAGGISTNEINRKTMESKLVPGLYFAGEIIDIDGVTGGFNLQAAFSTGWLAGNSAASS